MKKTRTLFFRMMLFATLYSLYPQAADGEVLCDTEIVVTGIKENSGTIVISIHDSAESFRKHIPYRNVKLAVTENYRLNLRILFHLLFLTIQAQKTRLHKTHDKY